MAAGPGDHGGVAPVDVALRPGHVQLPGQEPPGAVAEPVDARLQGELRLDGTPADSGTVVLHRVTPAEAGPVDSVQVGPGGRFTLELPGMPVPGSGEILFASARYEGILYFGPPITEPAQLDSVYRLDMYASRAAPVGGLPFPVSVRNLFIETGPMGWQVTDLFEIRNDSSVTWVQGEGGGPVWRYPLPPGALSPRVGQSDLAEDAVRFEGGALSVYSPVPPGERLYVIQYDLESLEFSLPLPGRSEIVELLVREPAPALVLEGLRRDQPVQLEADAIYSRWSGEEVVDRAVRVWLGEDEGRNLLPWIGLLLGLLLVGATIWAARQPEGGGELAHIPGDDGMDAERRRLVAELNRLDEDFAALEAPDEARRDRYRLRRRDLLAALDRLGAPPHGEGGRG